MKQKISRKEFLRNTTKFMAGVGIGIAAGEARAAAVETRRPTPAWPWPYRQLDPERVRVFAHDVYYRDSPGENASKKPSGCCYGTFHAIVKALQKTVGEPYTNFPSEMMIFGHDGFAEWGTLCGTLNGAGAAVSLVTGRDTADKLLRDLAGWYTQTKFPTDKSNEYATKHVFADQRNDKTQAQSASGSPLCHVSVTEWCNRAGFGATSAERKERCARLAGDVASRAVELLNQHFGETLRVAYAASSSVELCNTCHGPNKSVGNVNSQMNCVQCHGDPHAAKTGTSK